MTANDNADRGNGRRDEDAIPAGCPECIRLAIAECIVRVLQRDPEPLPVAMRNRARLLRSIGGDA